MVSETITITTAAKSIAALIADVRGVTVPEKCVGIKLRYEASQTSIVSLHEDGVSTGAVVLDANLNPLLLVTSFKLFNLTKAFLKTNTGSATVHIIIEQTLV